MAYNSDADKPLLKRFNYGIKSIFDFIPYTAEGDSSKQGLKEVDKVKLSIIKDLKDSRYKVVQAIVEDDALFQELKEKLRKERVVTNAAVVVLLHCTVLESMIPSVSSKASSPEINSSRHSTNNKMFLPLSRAIKVIQKFVIAFVSEERKKRHVADSQNFARMKDAVDFMTAQPRRRSSSSYSATFIKSPCKEVNSYPTCNNLLFVKTAAYTNPYGSPCQDVPAMNETKPSRWTEETIRDLYEDTILRSRHKTSPQNTLDELREIEDVHSKSLADIYEYYSRRDHERAVTVSFKRKPLCSFAA
jgi:hypothetical protein